MTEAACPFCGSDEFCMAFDEFGYCPHGVMLNKNAPKIYATEHAAKIAANKLNQNRSSIEVDRGRYIVMPAHPGWTVIPVYY